jgi:hypothetical protein
MTVMTRLLAATFAVMVWSTTVAVAQSGVLAPPQASPQDDAEANRRASSNYDAVLQDRPAFRAEREQLECAGIESLDLRAQCLATFESNAPRRSAPPPPPTAPATAPPSGQPSGLASPPGFLRPTTR